MAFYKLFPWGYDTAFLACLISNMMRGKNVTAFTVDDFMPADRKQIDAEDNLWENLRKLSKANGHGSN